jgi:hypothetical protein
MVALRPLLPRRLGRCAGIMWTWTATHPPGLRFRRMWRWGGRYGCTARPRPSGPGTPSPFAGWRSRRCVTCRTARWASGSWPGTGGRTPAWCSPPIWAPRWMWGMSGRCSNGSAPRPGPGTAGRRELRTSFVSLLSHRDVSTEEIARLVGHASTRTTEVIYRRELRPVITTGAEIMDELFEGKLAPPVGREPPRTCTSQPGSLDI